LRISTLRAIHPNIFTLIALLLGSAILPCLVLNLRITAFIFLLLSGFLDTLDGSLARARGKSSPKGAAFDIISDRIVEVAIVLGLYMVDPTERALPSLLMLGSILICVTSFLIVGVFTENSSSKSFHYSPGLIERAEAFVFFGAMILIPSAFVMLAYLFSALVLLTALIRTVQFCSR
jgi:phosphatidylglycerophosphate synthase